MFNIKKVKRLEQRIKEIQRQSLIELGSAAVEIAELKRFIKDKCYFRNSKSQIPKC